MRPKVSIIILNWNGWEDTIECIESLYQINYPNFDLIVLDNDSDDGSILKIKDYCNGEIEIKSKYVEYNPKNKPIKIKEYNNTDFQNLGKDKIEKMNINKNLILIKNNKNYGFAKGNNIGIKFALKILDSDYILILNNDTVVDKDFLSEMVQVAESDINIGFVGPKTYYYDFKGKNNILNFAGGKLNMWIGKPQHIGINEIDNKQYNTIKKVDYINGSCMLAKKEMLNEIGLLNPIYFLYWEENDWCYRAQKLGFESFYVPKAKIWHKTVVSIKKLGSIKDYYMIRNRIIFMRKFSSKIQFISFFLYLFPYFCVISVFIIMKMDNNRLKFFIKGINSGLKINL